MAEMKEEKEKALEILEVYKIEKKSLEEQVNSMKHLTLENRKLIK